MTSDLVRQHSEVYTWPEAPRWLRLNMAVDTLGRFRDDAGTSTGLSSPEDRELLRLIRRGADAVVVGAGTIRAEGWNLPPSGDLVVLSRSGDLPWDTCPDPARVIVVSEAHSPLEVIESLVSQGHVRILIEGGAVVARWFAAGGLLSDICLTISNSAARPSPHELLRALHGLLPELPRNFNLASAFGDTTTRSVFTLWRRAIDAPEGPEAILNL